MRLSRAIVSHRSGRSVLVDAATVAHHVLLNAARFVRLPTPTSLFTPICDRGCLAMPRRACSSSTEQGRANSIAGDAKRVLTEDEKEEMILRAKYDERLKTRQMLQEPEPIYTKIVSGYNVYHHTNPFELEMGESLPEFEIAYETWGSMNEAQNNVILLHTGLSASSHAHSHNKNPQPGWWESFIGPGMALDTNKFFIICTNPLGGCYGSTGPSSVNPRHTGKLGKDGRPMRYALDFPLLTVTDMVRAQFLLLDHLKIDSVFASVGASLGGMQSLAAAVTFPDRVLRCISISAAGRSHPMSIALRYTQRRVLMTDPEWHGGNYYEHNTFPHTGMRSAREIATISYRSGPEWEERFGRKRMSPSGPRNKFEPDFFIETYLDHQGDEFSLKYDPNSLLFISKAMDMFDLGCGMDDYESGVARIQCPILVIGVQSDLLFPVWQQRELAHILRNYKHSRVTYYELDALYGHDTFLIDVQNVGAAVKGHLESEFLCNHPTHFHSDHHHVSPGSSAASEAITRSSATRDDEP